ncbi:MAG: hypothetical protein ACJ8AT_06670 [Hyalangium sp.]|uniref:hypothetical protein n=1 Tax=Hyalangium sp. TaxID=2028555 RepID=UPI00389A3343
MNPQDEEAQVNPRGSARTPRWVWGLCLGGAGLVLLLAALWPDRSLGPQPPEPVHLPELASGAPPPAPLVSPAAERAKAPPEDLLAREAAIRTAEKDEQAQKQLPKLRRSDPGLAPKKLVRTYTGKSAGKGVVNLQLVATFQGHAVSAPVEVDGVWRGNTPLAVTIAAGSHAIRIDHSKTRVNQFVAQVPGGKSVEMEVELRPASEARGNRPGNFAKTSPHHH